MTTGGHPVGATVKCDRCGRVSQLPYIEGMVVSGNTRNIVVNCPCGAELEPVPRGDGIISTVGGRLTWNGAAVKAARSLVSSSAEELEAMRKALNAARQPEADIDTIAAQLEQINAGFTDLAAAIRSATGSNRSMLVATWLGALVGVITLLLTMKGGPKPATADDIERLLKQQVATVQQTSTPRPTVMPTVKSSPAKPRAAAPAASAKPAPVERPPGHSKNAPCHCGSGRRLKRCCGAPAR